MLRRATVTTLKATKSNKFCYPIIPSYLVSTRCFQSNQNQGGYKPRPPTDQQYNTQSQPTQGGNQDQQQTSLFNFELGDDVVVSVEPFRGIPIIHLRKHYYDKKTKLRRPGKQGITLLSRNLDKLIQYIDDIDADILRLKGEQGNVDAKYSFELDNPPKSKIVQVVVQSSVVLVFFQQPQMENKYIAITVEQFELLKSILPNLKSVVSAATPQIPSETLLEVPLSNWTLARVIKFGSKNYVDLRKLLNTNAAGGAPPPPPSADNPSGHNFSKAGISLNNFEWQNLMDNLEPLYNAIRAGDTAYFLDLGRNRRVSLSLFNQVWYLSVREFYNAKDSDQLLPSKKGVNLRMEEWSALVEQFPSISQALTAATEKQ